MMTFSYNPLKANWQINLVIDYKIYLEIPHKNFIQISQGTMS